MSYKKIDLNEWSRRKANLKSYIEKYAIVNERP